MAKITITDEQAIRTAIANHVDAVALAGNVFTRRRAINSRQDFFQKLGVAVGSRLEIRFAEIELLNIEDSPDEGPDDCPVAVLTYNVHLFHEFVDGRADNSNSDTDFTDLLIRLRTAFLNQTEFAVAGWIGVVQEFTPAEFTQFGPDTFTDAVGHFKDFNLVINVYDE